MSTKFLSPGWRMPRNANQSKSSNYSLNFDGGLQRVTASNFSGLANKNSGSFSLWFKTTNTTSNAGKCIFSIPYSSSGNGFDVYINNSTSLVSYLRTTTFTTTTTSTITYGDGNWHHVAVVYDGSTHKIYFDTVDVTNTSAATPSGAIAASTVNTVEIARFSSNYANEFNGQIYGVSIFDYALSSSQVTTLYGTGSAIGNPMALPSPPVAYYPLGTSAYNGEYLAENNAIGDYVFDNTVSSRIFTNINVSNLTNVTQAVWFKTSTNGQLTKHIFHTGQYGTFVLQLYGTDTLRIGVTVNPLTQTYPSLTFNYADGKWHQYVVNYDGSHVKLYIDGVLKIKTARAGDLRNEPTYFTTIGNIYNPSSNAGATGEYSNFISYEHTLTDGGVSVGDTATGEIATLYNYGSPIRDLSSIPQSSNLKAWYKLDASEIYDSSNTQWQIANNVLSNKAYSFNGTSNIEIAQNSSIQTSNFSIGLWIKGYPQLDKTIIENGGANGFSIKTKHDDATKVLIRTGGVDGLTLTGALNGEWNFVYFTMSGNISRGGINGAYGNDGGAARNYDSSKGLFIGSKSDSTSGFTGEIAQVVYYDERGPNNATGLYGNLPANPPPNPLVGEANPNLVSWWKLDAASITDSEGSNNGTNNGATLIDTNVGRPAGIGGLSSGMSQANLVQSDLQTVAPYSKYAMSFDGTDSLTVGSLFGQVQDVFSVSTWVNFTSNPGYQMILSDNIWFANYTANNIGLDIKNSSGSYYDNNGGLSQGTNFVIPSDLRTNEWINVAFSYVGSSSGTTAVIKMYLNGAEVVSTTVTYSTGNANLQNASNVYLGSRNGSSNYLNGSLSNLSIWNYALTSSQVREIYNEGLPSNLNTFSGTAPVSWWQLGENSSYVSGWTFADEMPAGNNGTSGNLPEVALVNGVGTTANGTSTGMSEGSLVGDAPYSDANAVSSGMAVTARGTDVP